MASFGHIAVGLAAGRAYVAPGRRAGRAMLAFSVVSLWPDLDVIGFALGVPYGHPLGHRGATHSLFAALCVGAGAWGLSRIAGWPPWRTAAYAFVVAASHGLLDTLTFGGGLGCELLWPFSTARFWSPVRLIPIAPIGAGLFSRYGLWVMLAEGVLFSPFWLYAVMRRPRA